MRFVIVLLVAAFVAAPVFADRESIEVTTAPGQYPTDGTAVTWTTGTNIPLNGLSVTMTGVGKEFIVIHNWSGGSANVSISSVADKYGRTGDIANDAIADETAHVYGPFGLDGWKQTDGKLYIGCDSNSVSVTCIRLP